MSLKIGQLQISRRDRLCIIAEILQATREEISKTRIMQQANLSSLQFNRFILIMLKSRLIGRTLKRKRLYFRITEKGSHYLRVYSEAMDLFGTQEPLLVMSYVH